MRMKVLSKKTYRIKKGWAYDKIARLSVTGPRDPVEKPSHFYFQICRRDVFLLTDACLRS